MEDNYLIGDDSDFLEVERNVLNKEIERLEKKCKDLELENEARKKREDFFRTQYVTEMEKNRLLINTIRNNKEKHEKLIETILGILEKKFKK